MMANCVKKQAVDVETPATCVEWCPISGFQQLLACGTYQLIQDNDRIGFLSLFNHHDERIQISQKLDAVSGVLDVKWSPIALRGHPALAVVNSRGFLEMYEIEDGRLASTTNNTVGTEIVLALSLDWSSTEDNCDRIVTSDSDGRLSLFQLMESRLQLLNSWKAHAYEAWTVAFNYRNSNLVYSGGDDSKFKGWDLRQPSQSPMFISQQHTMGVTSVQSNCWNEYMLATGSYDESMVIWDLRRTNVALGSIGLGGGVWRIKFNPEEGRYALVACMHNGAAVVDCAALDAPRRVAHYDEHDSMVYGVDWKRSDDDDHPSTRRAVVASCSFYDKSLHLWNFKTDDYDGGDDEDAKKKNIGVKVHP